MLLPLVAVAAVGTVMFRASVAALEDFQRETVGEATLIEAVKALLVQADDLGEAYVETDDPDLGSEFDVLAADIDRGFVRLGTLATPQERALAAEAHELWVQVLADLDAAALIDVEDGTDDRLDPFTTTSTKRPPCSPTCIR